MVLASSVYATTAAAMVLRAPEWLTALLVLGTLTLTGRAWARRWSDPLDRAIATGWCTVGVAVVAGAVAKAAALGGAGVLAVGLILHAAAPRGAAPRRASVSALVAIWAPLVVVLAWGVARRDDLLRPLDGYWWYPPAESLATEAVAPQLGEGWARQSQGVWKEWGARRIEPRRAAAVLVGPTEGPMVLAVRGPVGAVIWVGDTSTTVRPEVTESPEEGPVWRYLDAGVAALTVERALAPGERLEVLFSHPERSTLYVVPSTDALWALHNTGELRHTHYYQLLNMVEQLRWARDRWVTDVQPPLWTRTLAPVLDVSEGGQPTANLTLLAVLVLNALAAARMIRRFAPDAPLSAWLLPTAAAIVHGRLLLDPGSSAMPDSLYAAAILTALSGPVEAFGLVAQLLRYPATGVVAVGAVLAGEGRRAVRLFGVVAVAAAAFGLGGLATGALPGWLETVAWESGPEHWHGEYDPTALLPRVPSFAAAWIAYAGGAPLLAAVAWPRGTRVALGTALIYAGLLATIDHHPTHYFIPLVYLSVVALACTTASLRHRPLRAAWAWLGLLGLSIWETMGPIFD